MKRKKIVLYHPATHHEKFYSFFWIPYSLLTIASSICDNYETIIIDENLNEQYNVYKLIENCLCVGISVMTGQQIIGALKFTKIVKSINPQIPIIWGGCHPTLLPEITISNSDIDFLVIGRGEIVFNKLIAELETSQNFIDIENIVYKKDNQIVYNKIKNDIILVNSFNWNLLNINNYIRQDEKIGKNVINYVSSFGCPFDCTFCSEVALYQNKWLAYDNKRIINDIQFLLENTNAKSIKFFDANFFGNPNKAIDFAKRIIELKLIFNWAAAIHPKTLSELNNTDLEILQNSNCCRLLIGAESGYQPALDIINKKITANEIIISAIKCSEFNVNGSFTFIVGLPNCDIEKEIEETINIGNQIRRINSKHDVKIHFYAPYPNTLLFHKAIEFGFKPPKTLQDWADYDYYNIETPWIKKDYEKVIHSFNSKNCIYVHL